VAGCWAGRRGDEGTRNSCGCCFYAKICDLDLQDADLLRFVDPLEAEEDDGRGDGCKSDGTFAIFESGSRGSVEGVRWGEVSLEMCSESFCKFGALITKTSS